MILPIDPPHMRILCFNICARATFILQDTYGRGLMINIQLDKQKTGRIIWNDFINLDAVFYFYVLICKRLQNLVFTILLY